MKLNIKKKLFLVITAVLSINIAAVLLFGGAFLEEYYVSSVKRDLRIDSIEIKASYLKNDLDKLEDRFKECVADNVTVLIYERGSNQVLYSTARPHDENGMASGIDVRRWIKHTAQEGVFARLEQEDPIILEEDNGVSDSIYLYSKINDETYLFMETPREHISSTTQVAMRFFVLLSIFTLIVGMIAVYFVAERIAKPIRQIDVAAQRIAAMDFSEPCEIHTGDEIEQLSHSINKMASELSKNIDLLKKDLEREEQTNRIRQEFVANVSHDFKTPLSLITAYTEALKDGSIEQTEGYDVLFEQCARMNRLVSQMLTLSQLESGMLQYDMSVFSLNELLRSVVESFQLNIKRQEIVFSKNEDEEYIVYGDYHRIEQVVINLFENALKYVDDKKQIWIKTKRNEDGILVIIGNSHPPLTDEQKSSVFEIFYRVDSSRENSKKGHGIGLAIVKNIVEAHCGRYGVSNCDDGVEFWFTLSEVPDEIDEDFEEI